MKNLLKKSEDPYEALLSYRATPLSRCDLSPAELCMGRRLRTFVPQADKLIVPQWPYLADFRKLDQEYKRKQKQNFDRRFRARDLPPLPDYTELWITTDRVAIRGRVVSPASRPRSYIVETPSGRLRGTATN